jgi:hypothetical protein
MGGYVLLAERIYTSTARWRKQDDSLAALFDNGSALAMFLADGGRCDTWWPK